MAYSVQFPREYGRLMQYGEGRNPSTAGHLSWRFTVDLDHVYIFKFPYIYRVEKTTFLLFSSLGLTCSCCASHVALDVVTKRNLGDAS